MSRHTDSTQGKTPHVSDLVKERERNLTRLVPVRNLHRSTAICHIPPNELGTVTAMDAHAHRAWLRKVTVEEGITDDELLGKAKPKPKPRKEAQ